MVTISLLGINNFSGGGNWNYGCLTATSSIYEYAFACFRITVNRLLLLTLITR